MSIGREQIRIVDLLQHMLEKQISSLLNEKK